jgi:FlaA1/EpsC-like NDP-sugar epimerase
MIKYTADRLLSLPRWIKISIAVLTDVILCSFTTYSSLIIKIGGYPNFYPDFANTLIISLGISLPVFVTMGLYRAIFRYNSMAAITRILKANFVYFLIFAIVVSLVSVTGVPRTIPFIQPPIYLIFILFSRVVATYFLGGQYLKRLKISMLTKVALVGIGTASRQFSPAFNNSDEMNLVCYFDIEGKYDNKILNGRPIYSFDRLEKIVANQGIEIVILAISAIENDCRQTIIDRIRNCGVKIKLLPDFQHVLANSLHISDLREPAIEDLIGRRLVEPRHELLSATCKNKIVMVVGAGGSIGSELCRQIALETPKTLVLLDNSEFALYKIYSELVSIYPNSSFQILPLLGSIVDYDRMNEIFSSIKPDSVYHAAAYKHVPLVENNVFEGIKNNVMGTTILVNSVIKYSVCNFVLISTDKAVRPTNIMGASKRLSELIVQANANAQQNTKMCIVRFGNVLGSSGSVIPLFRQQIDKGGPITVTDKNITRYFMTIPEAAQLVLQAAAMATNGDLFVLNMGQPVKIYDLAKRMVELSGLQLDCEDGQGGDIKIKFTGLRIGEKLYEELFIGENPLATEHPRIMKAREFYMPMQEITKILSELDSIIIKRDFDGLINLLEKNVSGFHSSSGIQDLIYTLGKVRHNNS